MPKRAIITGVSGQDGSYLAELLLDKGYEVTGIIRRLSHPNLDRIAHLLDRIKLHPADLLDELSLIRAIEENEPDEFYNLAAMSFVPVWQTVTVAFMSFLTSRFATGFPTIFERPTTTACLPPIGMFADWIILTTPCGVQGR